MSGGKTLQDLINEHKDEEDKQVTETVPKLETEEDRKRREQRLAAINNRLSNKTKVDDRAAQEVKVNPYKSSGGVNQQANEDRARALLNKNDRIYQNILKKEEQQQKQFEQEALLKEQEMLNR